MLRPPRSRGRFQGEGTSLSNPYAEADGNRLRRRYAVYAAMATILIIGIVAMAKNSGSGTTRKPASSAPPQAPKHAYVVESQYAVPEIKANVQVMKHAKSGLQFLSILPDDLTQDAVFGISFRTKADDNSGIAYVVQKALQDGSETYPVKDPFNQLERGSLRTYMESWVEKDRSVFVYASRNKVDFRNGVRVYLDGIFKPNFMKENFGWIFRQEGWRLTRVGDGKIGLSGNAINEAKAAQMNPGLAHENYVYKTLFDGHPYSFMEKGDFRDVVTLTETKLQDFYTKYYHPSNGKAFCFGPQDFLDECTNLMDLYLSQYSANDKIHKASDIGFVALEKIASVKDSVAYPTFQDTNDYRIAVSYILNDQPLDARTQMAWHIITDLLLGGPAAIIPRVIADQNLGDDAIGGLQSHLKQWVLTVGVSGVPSEEKVDEARIRLQQSIITAVSDGFAEDALKGTLNKLDVQFREQSSDGVPRGVKMFKDVLALWNYDGDPRSVLSYSKAYAEIKKEIEENGQGILLQLITRHMADNEHILTTELYPSSSLLELYGDQEFTWLNNMDDLVTVDGVTQILEETDELLRVQDMDDSQAVLDSISYLTVGDLRAMSFEIPTKKYDNVLGSGMPMLEHEIPHSNGIAYVDFAVDISNMDFDDVVLLPLFCRLLVQSGTASDTGIVLQRRIDAQTGGLTVEPVVEEIIDVGSDGGYIVPTGENMETKIVVRASCVAESGCIPMFTVIRQVLYQSVVTDQALAIDILKKLIGDMEDDIQLNPHKYTTVRVQSQYGLPGFIREQWQGVTQLLNLRRALQQARSDWSTLSARLVLMTDAMRRGHRSGMAFSLTGDKAAIAGISVGVQSFFKDILPASTQSFPFPDFATTSHPWYTKGNKRMSDEITAEAQYEAFLAATRLNSVAKGGLLFDPGEPVRGHDLVVLEYIGGYFLYKELRFGQGASDAMAVLDIDTGSVVYQSNQAPDIGAALDIYDQGVNFVVKELGGKSSLPPEAEGAIIGAIAKLDGTAIQPSQVGYVALLQYLKRDSKASRQKFRDEILGSTVSQLLTMADRLGSWGKPSVAVVTNQALYDEAVAAGLTLSTCRITGLVC